MKKSLKIFVCVLLTILFLIFTYNIFEEFQHIDIKHTEIDAYNSQIDKFKNTYHSTLVDYTETIERYKGAIASLEREIFSYTLNVIKYCIFLILIVVVELKLLPVSKIKEKIFCYLKTRKQKKIQKLEKQLHNLKERE